MLLSCRRLSCCICFCSRNVSVCECAGVIAATTANERTGFDTYHVVNPHWTDGVSLDRIVDWVESAGYPVSHLLVLSCSHVKLFQ